jgi:anti-anti-sigma factor
VIPSDYQPHYIKARIENGITFVAFQLSEVTDDDNIDVLGRELFSLVDQFGCEKIVLDLAGVAYITSSVLGKIISLHRKQSRSGGRLVLCNLEPGLSETLQTSRLLSYFDTAANSEAAIAMLG